MKKVPRILKHIKKAQHALLAWHALHGRHDLPWKGPDPTGYRTSVSEIMMQQTTVAVGRKRFPLFVERFKSWEELAQASIDDVMKEWEGLGYYRRARFLHQLAREVVEHHQGQLPKGRPDRLALPGVGPSTASALGAFVYGLREPIWDANVERVMTRVLKKEWPEKPSFKWKYDLALSLVPQTSSDIQSWTQALMDLGATVCTIKSPKCEECPWSTFCQAYHMQDVSLPMAKQTLKKEVNLVWDLHILDKKVLVCNPQEGVWAGLWQLPRAETSKDPKDKGEELAQGTHVLTHRKVHWRVVKKANFNDPLPQGYVWVDWSALQQLGFPKPLANFWSQRGANLLG